MVSTRHEASRLRRRGRARRRLRGCASTRRDDPANEALAPLVADLVSTWNSPCLAHVARFFPAPRPRTFAEFRELWYGGISGVDAMIGGVYVRDGRRWFVVPPPTPSESDDALGRSSRRGSARPAIGAATRRRSSPARTRLSTPRRRVRRLGRTGETLDAPQATRRHPILVPLPEHLEVRLSPRARLRVRRRRGDLGVTTPKRRSAGRSSTTGASRGPTRRTRASDSPTRSCYAFGASPIDADDAELVKVGADLEGALARLARQLREASAHVDEASRVHSAAPVEAFSTATFTAALSFR